MYLRISCSAAILPEFAYLINSCPIYQTFEKAFGVKPVAVYKAVDFLVKLNSEDELRKINPDFAELKKNKKEARVDNDSFGNRYGKGQ